MGVVFLNCICSKSALYSVECNFNKAGENIPHIDNLRDYKTCIFNKYKQTIILYTCKEIHI